MKEVESDKIETVELDSSQIELKYDSESNLIVGIKNLIIPPLTEVVLSFGVRKIMMPFEDYPNDPNRGFNIPQMPLYYSLGDEKGQFFSKTMLVQNMEPDFSMPFNVNAVTNALIGLLFINTYNVIVKPKRFL